MYPSFNKTNSKCKKAKIDGKKNIKLFIGRPFGLILPNANDFLTEAILTRKRYIQEKSFAKQFVKAHVRSDSDCNFQSGRAYNDMSSQGLRHNIERHGKNIEFLTIGGIGSVLELLPLVYKTKKNSNYIATTTAPGYPAPKAWCNYLGLPNYALKTDISNDFLFSSKDIRSKTNLIMMNYPHSPSGQVATRRWLEEICRYCQKKDIALFNDAVYHMLSYTKESVTLTEVAANFPGLVWAEAFSASKVIGNIGFKIGAMAGSCDIISSVKKVACDVWLIPSLALAEAALELVKNKALIQKLKQKFSLRIDTLVSTILNSGMKLAVKPKAGFFTLWQTPKEAFGQKIKSARQFNLLMIEKTGVAGTTLEPYIRYSVYIDIKKHRKQIEEAFKRAEVVF